jgi:Retrotransposon gag protein
MTFPFLNQSQFTWSLAFPLRSFKPLSFIVSFFFCFGFAQLTQLSLCQFSNDQFLTDLVIDSDCKVHPFTSLCSSVPVTLYPVVHYCLYSYLHSVQPDLLQWFRLSCSLFVVFLSRLVSLGPMDPSTVLSNPVTQAEHVLVQQQQELTLQHQRIVELVQSVAQLQARLTTPPVVSRPPLAKPTKPNTFNGQNLQYAPTWLVEMEHWFSAVDMDDKHKVSFAAAQLRDAAAVWWMTVSPTDLQPQVAATISPSTPPDIINTWSRFKEAFLKVYNPVPVKDCARMEIENLQQTDSVQQYVNTFRYWIQFLRDSMDEETKLFQFRKGLKKYLQLYLLTVKPTTLNEAMNDVTRRELEGRMNQDRLARPTNNQNKQNNNSSNPPSYNRSRSTTPPFRRPGTNNYKYNNTSRTVTTTTSGDSNSSAATPMELGNLRDRDYEEKYGSDAGGAEAVADVNAVGLQQITPAEREDCMKRGLCFRCRVGRHLAKDCPKNSNTNTNNTRTVRHF